MNSDPISSAVETIKELKLQREDDNIQKMIAKMSLMKQIQRKTEENKKLEKALEKLSERRKLINRALNQQKIDADKKRKNVLDTLQRQKEIMTKNKLNQQKHRESIKNIPEQEIFEKTEMLEAHKLLVDKSNQRILDRIEEIKLSRQRGALAEQERLVREQQAAIDLIRKIQSQRKHNMRENLRRRPTKKVPKEVDPILSLSQYLEKAKASLTLDPEEKKQMMEWMDLEKNAAILHKTDKAIAQKIRSASIKSDQQPDISEKDIDDILGIGGLGDLSDLLSLNSDTQISIDSSLIEDDYEFDDYQDEYYEYDQTQEMSQPQQSNVRTRVQRLPGGRVSTKVSIGLETPRPHIQRLGPRDFNIRDRGQRPRSFSDLMMN